MWRSVGRSDRSNHPGAGRLRPLSRSAATLLTVLGCLLLLPAAAHAQSAIAGVVRDVSGAVVPGVKLSRPDVGGSQGMEQTYMRTHGADDRHTSMQVDGMSVNSSMGDGNIQAYNDDALAQQVVFQTSALPAEVAAGGVRVNMIPKDGGNTFTGGGFFGGTAHGWQADNNTDELRARDFRYRNFVQHVQDFNFNMGGPIVRDKFWFFSTARHVSVDEGVANTYYKVPYQKYQVGDPAIQEQFVRDVLVRLTYQATLKNK